MSEHDSKNPAPTAALMSEVREMAITLARRENLIADDGQLYCWNCNRLGGLMPALVCRACLDEHLDRTAQEREAQRRLHPETHRWRALERTMATESRLDREAAADLLRRAHELESATPERREMLTAAFEARFGQQRQSAEPAWGGRRFRRAGGMGDER